MSDPTPPPAGSRPWTGRGAVIAAVVALLLGGLWFLPVRSLSASALVWFETAGPAGWFGYGLLYLVVTLALLPTSVLTVGGGFVFGPVTGFFVVWISENVAALACFVIGRFAARPYVQRMVARSPTLQALDHAMEDRGFSLLVLLRHSPIIPFSVLNYSMALTGLSATRYLVATLVGTALPAFAYVYVGSTLTRLSEVMQGKSASTPAEHAIYWGGLVATLAATFVVGQATRRALNARLAEAGVPRDGSR